MNESYNLNGNQASYYDYKKRIGKNHIERVLEMEKVVIHRQACFDLRKLPQNKLSF